MSPNDIAGLVGAAATGAVGIAAIGMKYVIPWLKTRDTDVKAIKRELGVGLGDTTMNDLVISTASAVQRLESNGQRAGAGISEIITTLRTHGHKLDEHDKRFSSIEERHEALDARVTLTHHTEKIAALLATKTEQVAAALAVKTERIAADLKRAKKRGVT